MSSDFPNSASNSEKVADQPLYSDFADDADMLELVEMFVDEMPNRIASIEDSVQKEDVATLAKLSHQLKGAAGGYGFGTITEAAAELEQQAKAEKAISEMQAEIANLISLCRRATSSPQV